MPCGRSAAGELGSGHLPAARSWLRVHVSGRRAPIDKLTDRVVYDQQLEDANPSPITGPETIVAGIGPSIGPCCYEVGPEVVQQVLESFGGSDGLLTPQSEGGRAYFNLWAANRKQLLDSGVPDGAIEESRLCTRCNSDLFFSARSSRVTGRFAAGIVLLDEMCAECTAMHCSGCRG